MLRWRTSPLLRSRTSFLGLLLWVGSWEGTSPLRADPPQVVKSAEIVRALPSPPEYFLALSKDLKPRWRTLYQPSPTLGRADRPRSALLLGTLVADMYTATEARDGQRIRNLCQDLRANLLSLGLAKEAEERMQLIARLADNEEWAQTRSTLEGGQQNLTALFRSMQDDDLALLGEIGLWLRSLETGSRLVQQGGDAQHALHCIGSLDLIKGLQQRADQLSAPTKKIPFIIDLQEELERIARRWEKAGALPTKEDIDSTTEKLSNFLKRTFEKA